MLLNCGVGEDSWESLGLQGDPTSPSWRRSVLGVHWKDWCWSWNSNILPTSCEKLTHWERPWYWEGLGAGEGDNRGWDGWMASPTRWTRVWVNSGSWWWTGRPGVLRFMGSQRIGHDWATELNWIDLNCYNVDFSPSLHSFAWPGTIYVFCVTANSFSSFALESLKIQHLVWCPSHEKNYLLNVSRIVNQINRRYPYFIQLQDHHYSFCYSSAVSKINKRKKREQE